MWGVAKRASKPKKTGWRLQCETQPGLHSYGTKVDCPKIIRGLLLSFLSPSRDNTLLLPQKFLTTFHRVIVDIFIVSTDTIILCEAAWAVGVGKQPFLLAPRRWGRFAVSAISAVFAGYCLWGRFVTSLP